MENDGYDPDVVIYTILVNAFCKAGNVDEAFATLDVMKKQRILPNLHTYNTLICGLLSVNRLNDALGILAVWSLWV